MSHFKSKVAVYTNEDGFRVPSIGYQLPKEKPAGQLRIAFLGGSLVQLASTYETTLPGSLRTLLRKSIRAGTSKWSTPGYSPASRVSPSRSFCSRWSITIPIS